MKLYRDIEANIGPQRANSIIYSLLVSFYTLVTSLYSDLASLMSLIDQITEPQQLALSYWDVLDKVLCKFQWKLSKYCGL